MIRKKRQKVEYETAVCDGCKRDLRQPAGEGFENVNYGLLKASFGWPSTFDDTHGPEYHLCEGCWIKALALFNLPTGTESTGERYMPDGRVFDSEGNDTGETWDVQGEIARAQERGRKAPGRCPDNGQDHGRTVRCDLGGGHDGPHQFVPWSPEAEG